MKERGMFAKVLLTASIIITGAIFACGNNLTGLEKEIVGTWRFVEVHFAGIIADVPISPKIRFNSNYTWEDDHGGKGTWRLDTRRNPYVETTDHATESKRDYHLKGYDLLIVSVSREEAIRRLSGNTELIAWIDRSSDDPLDPLSYYIFATLVYEKSRND